MGVRRLLLQSSGDGLSSPSERPSAWQPLTGPPRTRSERRAERYCPIAWQARILGLAVTAAGVACVAAALARPWRGRLRLVQDLFTPQITSLAAGAVALAGLALILVGRGVAQRRRLAFYITVRLYRSGAPDAVHRRRGGHRRGIVFAGRAADAQRPPGRQPHPQRGVRTQILREGELDRELRRALLDVAAAQRREFREFGFSMALGDVLTGAHPGCMLVVCRDRAGVPIAFQRYIPCRRGHALSLDAMRRLPRAPGGVNERMIVEVLAWANANGASEVSLNFAAFRSLFEEDAELQPGQAMEAWLMRRMEGRFGIQMDSLRRFNAKFGPRWIPRYLAYRSPAHLPAIGLAALSAEGFLPFDHSRAAETSAVG
jgi:lysylphosphatidylglycerol synthetase-like protein (DUF2156 family)